MVKAEEKATFIQTSQPSQKKSNPGGRVSFRDVKAIVSLRTQAAESVTSLTDVSFASSSRDSQESARKLSTVSDCLSLRVQTEFMKKKKSALAFCFVFALQSSDTNSLSTLISFVLTVGI